MSPAHPAGCSNPIVAVGLALILAVGQPTLGAQGTSAPKLHIVIVDGEGAINNIRQRTAREPVVQVQDENNKPVAGAVVTFTLPDRGASGVFANGQTTTIVTTDSQGRAVGTGLRPNSVEGDFQIRVTVSHSGQTASALISQTNSQAGLPGARGGAGKTVAILLLVAGGAAGGVVAALQRSKNGSPSSPTPPGTPPITISLGTPTVSPPR